MNESVCGDQSILQKLAEGALTGTELKNARSHVASCPACRRAVTEYKQIMWDLAHPPEVQLPSELDHSFHELMRAWKKEQSGLSSPRSVSRSFVPAWAGYSVSWTRRLPAINRLAPLLFRTGSAVIEWSLPRWLRRKGGGNH